MSTTLRAATGAAALAAFCTMLLPNDAQAQPGSRLCGWQTSSVMAPGNKPMPSVHVALVYEARQKEAAYGKKCDEAIKKMKGQLPKTMNVPVTVQGKPTNVPLTLQWKEVKKATCESVGASFAGQGVPKDICDKMGANQAFKFVKSSADKAATIEKLK